MALQFGIQVPLFKGKTHARPDFAFGSLGGAYVLMAFLPDDPAAHAAGVAVLEAIQPLMDDTNRMAFGVIRDPQRFAAVRPRVPGLRYFLDEAAEIGGLFRLSETERAAGWLILIDPMLRVMASLPFDRMDRMRQIVEDLGPADDHAAVPVHAPVLIVPRVFEPAFCRRLIDVYHADGGGPSGVMREIDGKTVGVLDGFKKRRDANITDEALMSEIRARIIQRLLPEIEKAFVFKVTRMERYIVARYDAEDGGYFKPHRDNNTKGTAHRQFACSINLNAEEFEGGDLRFAEFGTRTYRPPTGGAVIFSCSLLHEATPVTRGSRFAFLPFFYDDAHARIREENLKFLQPDPVATDPEAMPQAATA